MTVKNTESTSLVEMRKANIPTTERNLPEVTVGFNTLQSFELIQRVAKMFSVSDLVPKNYKGNQANCVIALNIAHRLGADPLMVMQNLYVVYGNPSWTSQFLIASFNNCGRFSAMRFEFFGEKGTDDWGCRAWALEKSTGQKLEGSDITMGLARKEGWYNKSGSKWVTMPQQMLMYRAATWFVRVYAPEITMGLYTAEELNDRVVDLEPVNVTTLGNLREQNSVATEEIASAKPDFQADTTPDGITDEEVVAALKDAAGDRETSFLSREAWI